MEGTARISPAKASCSSSVNGGRRRRRANVGELGAPCGDEGTEDGLTRGAEKRASAAAVEHEGLGQVERLGEPVDDDHLELHGGRRGGPREGDDVDAGREGLAEGSDGTAGRREVRQLARALPVREAGQDEVADIPQRRAERVGLRPRRRVCGELAAQEAGVDTGGVHGVVAHAGVVVGDEVEMTWWAGGPAGGTRQGRGTWRCSVPTGRTTSFCAAPAPLFFVLMKASANR